MMLRAIFFLFLTTLSPRVFGDADQVLNTNCPYDQPASDLEVSNYQEVSSSEEEVAETSLPDHDEVAAQSNPRPRAKHSRIKRSPDKIQGAEIQDVPEQNAIYYRTEKPLPAVKPTPFVEGRVSSSQTPSEGIAGVEEGAPIQNVTACPGQQEGYTVNFEDICVIQLIRFISQISDINFVYDSRDLADIKITIVSEEPSTVHDLMGTLLQILRMRGLNVVEQGKNILIHNEASNIAKVSTIITDDNVAEACKSAVITRVFRVFNVMPDKAAVVIRPLLSKSAVVDVLNESHHIVISDITSNVDKVAELLTALDTPNASLDIDEYLVNSSNPDILAAYANEILAPLMTETQIKLIPQPAAGKIFIVSTPYLIQRAKVVLTSLDSSQITEAIDLPPTAMANNVFYVYKLQYRNGQDIADAVHDMGVNLQYNGVGNTELISAIYSIQWIDVNNSIVITGTQEAIDKVVALIEDLDTAPDQVYIEVLIIDTTIQNALNFGVEWIALANEQSKLAFATGLLSSGDQLLSGARNALASPPPNAARGAAAGTGDVPLSAPGFGLGIVGNVIRHNGEAILTLAALVNALETDQDSVIVLNPRIMTEDTREANFFVGQNIPYQTTNTIVRDTGSVTQNLQYEDIGIQLRVKPQVGPDRMVTMDIDQAISDVQSSSAVVNVGGTTGNQVLLAPTTNKILATTRVHVPDGCFLVMSGHIRDDAEYTRTGIPCLGTLPLIGPAFSNTVESRKKRNMLMFIQPHVVRNCREGIRLTNQEGYNYNWESHPSSIIDCEPRRAPECETCPPMPCPCR